MSTIAIEEIVETAKQNTLNLLNLFVEFSAKRERAESDGEREFIDQQLAGIQAHFSTAPQFKTLDDTAAVLVAMALSPHAEFKEPEPKRSKIEVV